MQTIYSAYYKSPIGVVKISADEHFVTELFFTDNETETTEPEPYFLSPILKRCVTELTEFFNGERQTFTIPVSQPGTPFQQKVWNELLAIPFGKTVSYLSLSKKLGDVKAIRAVAATNAKNKISILVPCHRVIGSNQSLVGYAWGIERKQWLLQHEAKLANGVQTLF